MANLKYTSLKVTSPLSVAAIVLCSVSAMAQNATDICRPAPVVPRASGSEPPGKIVIDPPLAENRSPPGEWWLSNIVLRTCTSCRCSAQMLWPSRHASDTFM